MNTEIIARAEEVIASKTGYIGDGMGGFATLALIDEDGYPTASTVTIAKADGIKWITFNTSLSTDKVKRINKSNRASMCINSNEYNITLVGTVEVLTDPVTKKDMWFAPMADMWSGPDDPEYCVLRFNTERYNLFFAGDDKEVKGTLKDEDKKTVPLIEPMLQFDGQCEQAIELYKKAFGAKVIVLMRFSEANPQDWASHKEDEKELIYHAQMMIGSQRILLCDNLFNDLPKGHSVYPVITFKTADEVKAAYNVLADGATIISPIGNTSYSACVVSFVDKFGIYWDLMAEW